MEKEKNLKETIAILDSLPSSDRRHLRTDSQETLACCSESPSPTDTSRSSGSSTPSTPEPTVANNSSSNLNSNMNSISRPSYQATLRHRATEPVIVVSEAVSNVKPSKPKRRATFRNITTNHQHSFFDSSQLGSNDFAGFIVLFWTTLVISTTGKLAENYFRTGVILDLNILGILKKDLVKVALTDLVMYLGMWVSFVLQILVTKKLLNWNSYGYIIQHIYQFSFLWFFIGVARAGDFPWIARIFLMLHSVVMLMKMHSYSAYNGHLDSITNELEICRNVKRSNSGGDVVKVELDERIKFCETELKMQSTIVKYPQNINAKDFFLYTMYPTVVYQLEYPKTDRIRKSFLATKLSAVFGLFVCLIIIAETQMYPVAMRAMELKGTTNAVKLQKFPFVLLDLIPPFTICYLITFFLIWDAILNSIAELTYFGDRQFYRDWWNTVQWDKFARDWNVPVHNFLYRHVYHSSVATLHISKLQASLFTFFLSALVHELAMYVIFGKLRGYLFFLQLSQVPLEFMSRMPFFKQNPKIGNAVFWSGILLGPSILCSLYLTF